MHLGQVDTGLRSRCAILAFLICAVAARHTQASMLARWEADNVPGAGGTFSARVTWLADGVAASSFGRDGLADAAGAVSPRGSAPSGDPVFREMGWADPVPTFGMTPRQQVLTAEATTVVSIRLYIWALSAGGGTFAVDDFEVMGRILRQPGEVVLARWEADDTPGPGGVFATQATVVAGGMSASGVRRDGATAALQGLTPSVPAPSGDPVFRQADWTGSAPLHFYEVSVGVPAGRRRFSVTRVEFYACHAAAGRMGRIRIDWSADGGPFVQGFEESMYESSMTLKAQTVRLPDAGHVVFRLYIWGLPNPSYTFAVDDISVFGVADTRRAGTAVRVE